MLECDLLLEVRTTRSLNREQVARLERSVFGAGSPSRDQIDMLLHLDSHVNRADPSWPRLRARAQSALREAALADAAEAAPAQAA